MSSGSSLAKNDNFSVDTANNDITTKLETPFGGYTARSLQHSETVTSHISSIYGDFETHDLKLVVGASSFPAHRVVLSQSPVFRAMLYGSSWRESTAKTIVLNEIEHYIPVFEDFLKYLYGQPILISWQNAEALVYFGDKYAIDALLTECLDFFYNGVEVNGDLLSALNGWKMIRRILSHPKECMKILISVLFSNMELIMKDENLIASMDEEDMTSFLSSDDILCRTEFTLFKLFEVWLLLRNDESIRMKLLLKFSPLLRLPYMHLQEMSYVENSPKRLFPDEASENFKVATTTMKSLLCDAYKYHVICMAERSGVMELPAPRVYLDGLACMQYRLMNTDGLSSWSKMDSYFKVKNSMSQADSGNRDWGFCVTLMRKINVHRQLHSSSSDKQRLSLLSLEVSQNFCGTIPFKHGVVYIHEKRAGCTSGSMLRRPLTRFYFSDSRMKSDIRLDNVHFENVMVKNSLYQYEDDKGNPVYLALDIFLLE